MNNSDSNTPFQTPKGVLPKTNQVQAVQEYLESKKFWPNTLMCLWKGDELSSIVGLVRHHFGNFIGIEVTTRDAMQNIVLKIQAESCAECGLYAPNHAKNCGSYGMEETDPSTALATEIAEAIAEVELLVDAERSGPHATRAKRNARVGQLSKIRLALYHAKDMIEDGKVRRIALVASIERTQKMFQYIAKGEAVHAQAEQGIIETSAALSLVRE